MTSADGLVLFVALGIDYDHDILCNTGFYKNSIQKLSVCLRQYLLPVREECVLANMRLGGQLLILEFQEPESSFPEKSLFV